VLGSINVAKNRIQFESNLAYLIYLKSNMSKRKLTELEIQLARKVFGNSIRYTEVKIFNEKYAFFQPDNSGMTPNGNIYIHGNNIEDYGVATVHPDSKSFFIHEMVHV